MSNLFLSSVRAFSWGLKRDAYEVRGGADLPFFVQLRHRDLVLLLQLLVGELLHLELLIEALDIETVLIVLAGNLGEIRVQFRVPGLRVLELGFEALPREVKLLDFRGQVLDPDLLVSVI
jgi:hypothetical protein